MMVFVLHRFSVMIDIDGGGNINPRDFEIASTIPDYYFPTFVYTCTSRTITDRSMSFVENVSRVRFSNSQFENPVCHRLDCALETYCTPYTLSTSRFEFVPQILVSILC